MTEEFLYFKRHLSELEKRYGGEVIAISDKKVIAHGKDMNKVYEDARTIVGNKHIFVTEIPKEKELLIL
ncbi:MAG: hypothetical protein CVT89_06220 [Candidatus Altiarchaeales archaeon HGW-Altiarchaeales-2]|nr:MAG: hypothetical protein CVT89_06220 [Candidatus Altiarchaeales archaeon HGW-Altiarchaeales-2]